MHELSIQLLEKNEKPPVCTSTLNWEKFHPLVPRDLQDSISWLTSCTIEKGGRKQSNTGATWTKGQKNNIHNTCECTVQLVSIAQYFTYSNHFINGFCIAAWVGDWQSLANKSASSTIQPSFQYSNELSLQTLFTQRSLHFDLWHLLPFVLYFLCIYTKKCRTFHPPLMFAWVNVTWLPVAWSKGVKNISKANFKWMDNEAELQLTVARNYSGTPLMRTPLGPSQSVLIRGVSWFQGLLIKSLYLGYVYVIGWCMPPSGMYQPILGSDRGLFHYEGWTAKLCKIVQARVGAVCFLGESSHFQKRHRHLQGMK